MIDRPRYFWRRLGAVIIDGILISLVLTLVFTALQSVVPLRLEYSAIGSSSACIPATDYAPLQDLVDILAVDMDESGVIQCETHTLGLMPRYTALVYAARRDQSGTFTRNLQVPVNGDLEPVVALRLDPIVTLMTPLIYAALLWLMSGQTPGKRLVGVAVISERPEHATFARYIAREYLLFAAVIVFTLLTALWMPLLVSADAYAELARALAEGDLFNWRAVVIPAVGIVLLLPYLISFFRWRGAMFYDRIAGFAVERTERKRA